MITGSIVAIVTPMHEDGSLDIARFRSLIDFHIKEGTDGIVVVGTTGESPTVNVEEHCELISVAVEHSAGRTPIIAGTGANSTREAIELTEFSRKAGAVAGLSVVPYYNRPTQEGLYQHFKSIAEASPLPMILYNVPGRTVADLSNDTALRLAEIPNIIGIKDATGSIDRACDLIARAPKDFALYTGDDMTAMAFMLLGGHGTISVRRAPVKSTPSWLASIVIFSAKLTRFPSSGLSSRWVWSVAPFVCRSRVCPNPSSRACAQPCARLELKSEFVVDCAFHCS